MDEAEWLQAVNPKKMIAALSGKGSERLWRLFTVACVRGVEHLLRDKRSRKALEVAERFADGLATMRELKVARFKAQAAAQQAFLDEYLDEARARFRWDAEYEAVSVARHAADAVLACVAENVGKQLDGPPVALPEGLLLPDLLREVFGTPFGWTTLDPEWLRWHDGLVQRLAETVYEERAFERLPVLADALEDAGCADRRILDHLRGPGPHFRGCWALDLLLMKS
jgi:hypothetical protein